MSLPLFAAAFALAAGPAPAVTVTLPAEVAGPVGRVIRLQAATAGRAVRWATAADGVDLVAFPDGKTALFCSPTPGRFAVFAWTAAGDEPGDAARCVVVVGPAKPADPFTADLARLAAADPADRAAVRALAGAYRAAADLAARPDVTTAGDLAARVRGLVQAAVGPAALPAVRVRIAEELAKHLPADADAALTADTRTAAAGLFAAVAACLEAAR